MRALALTLVLVAAAVPAQKSPQSNPAAPAAAAHSGGILFWNMDRRSVDFLLNHVPQSDTVRLAQLRRVFVDLQCERPRLREQTVPGGTNLICTLSGSGNAAAAEPGTKSEPEPGTILFLAHYEHEGEGRSAIEDWSGAIMLPFLYHALAAQPRNQTFIFAEVDGKAGAKALFEYLAARQQRIHGVVELDALGLGPVQFYMSANDLNGSAGWSLLPNELLSAANDEGLPKPAAAAPGAWFRIDDTREFRHHGIPSIVLHSVNWNARHLPGTAEDTEAAIDGDIYYKTIALLSAYAAVLDRAWHFLDAPSLISPRGRHR